MKFSDLKIPDLFRGIRKSLFLFLPLALLAGYAIHDALSDYGGVPYAIFPGTPNPGCNNGANVTAPCHGASSSNTVIHVYTTSAQVFAGSTDTLRISVADPAPADIAAGFDLDVDTPAMLDTIPGMFTYLTTPFQYGAYDITHSQPKPFTGDSAVWSMLYTARPTPGIDTIYAAGNAVDGQMNNDIQDHWDSIVVYVTVLPVPSSVAPTSSVNVLQVYPNPASNELFINDGTPSDVGTCTLTDPAGRVVLRGRETPLDGNHSVDISNIATGAYILSVQTRNGHSFVRRIVIQK